MKKVAIIGAGALGIVSAIMLKEDFEVTLIEKNNKIGKKILASGNGKCNFTNVGSFENKYNNEFAYNIVNKFTSEDTLKFFSSLGLVYKMDEENRVYPLSETSVTVLDVLKKHLKGVRILLDSKVNRMVLNDDGVELFYKDTIESFDYVICASGSCASNLGSEYAYSYLRSVDVKISELKASLSPVIVQEDLSLISGVRCKCLVNLYKDGKFLYKEAGEVLFKDNSLSGIVILNISSVINREKGKYKACLDLSYGAQNYDMSFDLLGVVHPKIREYMEINKLNDPTCLEFNVVSTSKYDNGQVISGGVEISELNNDLSLRKDKRVYLGGELIDCDGMCGGYNLQFAFSCAKVISESIKKANQ